MFAHHSLPSRLQSYPVMKMVLFCSVYSLLLASSAVAWADITHAERVTLPHVSETVVEHAKKPQTMLWPLLPGESVQSLAGRLYPQSPVLQQRFVQQALRYSRHRGIVLQADQPMTHAQLVVVPDAVAMHTLTRKIKKFQTSEPAAVAGLRLSMQLHPSASIMPTASIFSRLNATDWMQAAWAWLAPSTWHFPSERHVGSGTVDHWLQQGQAFFTGQWQRVRTWALLARDNYAHNRHQIAVLPMQALPEHPQLLLIVMSALLLFIISVFWGLREQGMFTR